VKSAKFPAFFATRGHSPFLHGLANGGIDSANIAKLLPKNGERILTPARMVVT
jgi:hypothetical protein